MCQRLTQLGLHAAGPWSRRQEVLKVHWPDTAQCAMSCMLGSLPAGSEAGSEARCDLTGALVQFPWAGDGQPHLNDVF